ncbi:hypothetical protein ACFPRL_31635 [Pseudoclavibacter helvolus]
MDNLPGAPSAMSQPRGRRLTRLATCGEHDPGFAFDTLSRSFS